MGKKIKSYTSDFKAKVALDAIRGELTLNEISKRYGVHSTQINRWKQQGLAGLKSGLNGSQKKAEVSEQQLIDDLYRQIGQLKCECDFLKKNAWS